ncbi:FAD-dependent oxidoreductase [Candidatus Solincola tengchongensis]|uniref:FAD-dependent oxidoreductase n=1 Tax=Candidatus Solincola tengchongensis TaxID=2900693 RepID=UPI00257C882D|nr:FAD-dependent oxidoreductase [Candidatus Solincola tengchongensis]
MAKIRGLEDLERTGERGLRKLLPERPRVTVGTATCGLAAGGGEVHASLANALSEKGLDALLVKVGCIGYCRVEPLVGVCLPGGPLLLLRGVREEDAEEIAAALERGRLPAEKALCRVEDWDHLTKRLSYGKGADGVPAYDEVPFFRRQEKVVMRNCGLINPEDIEEYIAVGGYRAALRALGEMTPEEVIAEVERSGLRGRGGAGFPTARKWKAALAADADTRYVICNADEGDPGAYMNRNVIESDPHSLLEGMLIGAYALGANEGIIYVRAEYPLAVERLRLALEQAERLGLLGDDVLGTGFAFRVTVARGAGSFVCGEETALIASLEGKTGRPAPRPPYPTESGLLGAPTVINNVETWCNVPVIIAKGGEWFSRLGKDGNAGTKVFSLVGKASNVGLVEVPMGTPVGEVVEDIGEGPPGGRRLKAVQVGGPSGGCLPARLLDTPLDYESLQEHGAIMGSGGMVVMDENTCMVDTARFFLEFTGDESCGKCAPCRDGLFFMQRLLEKISSGEGSSEDLGLLEELAEGTRKTSLCGLGRTAPNPVLTTLRHFREEYLEHVERRRCPAGVCEALTYAPCWSACPLGQDVPGYVAHIAAGDLAAAAEVIALDNPFPRVLSRVCHHPCERRCRLGETSQPVSICALKRVVADLRPRRPASAGAGGRKGRKGEKGEVAVVGSGPAGLSAAFFLARMGYGVTVLESSPSPGGMLRWGIPAYRLPRDVLEEEIAALSAMGVEFRTGVTVGSDVTLPELLSRGYGAVVLAVGLPRGEGLGIPGADAPGVLDGLTFLREVNSGASVALGREILVVGGGNTAVDAARCARRLAPEARVRIVYRRERRDMPAIPSEVEEAYREGVEMEFLTLPVRVISENGRVAGLLCRRAAPGPRDEMGRRLPVPLEGSDFVIPADTVIAAVGQREDGTFLAGAAGLEIKGSRLAADPETLQTGMPGVFAAGDVFHGPSTVVEAAASGRAAAESVDLYLSGKPMRRKRMAAFPSSRVPPYEMTSRELEEVAARGREEAPTLPPEERTGGFLEVSMAMDREAAVREARRCLRCDLKEVTR